MSMQTRPRKQRPCRFLVLTLSAFILLGSSHVLDANANDGDLPLLPPQETPAGAAPPGEAANDQLPLHVSTRSPQFLEAMEPSEKDIPNSMGVLVESSTGHSTLLAPSFQRLEENTVEWTFIGSWSTSSLNQASGGSVAQSNTAGDSAQFTFTGTWLSLGFIGSRFSGQVEVIIGGLSQGIFDLYRREETPVSLRFDGLSNAMHTLELVVLDSTNPLTSGARVQLDYADYGDGSPLPDGNFEEDDARLLVSNGWSTVAYAAASGGEYLRASNANAWFPFAGDSFSLHTQAYSSGGRAQLFVDGVYLDTIDLYAPVATSAPVARVFSYDGLGAGDHVLEIRTYKDTTTIDRLDTPGVGPFIDPNPPVTGVTRFEADHPAVRYNGLPLTVTAASWVLIANITSDRASAGEYVYSATAGDAVSFDFDGDWLGIGFATDRFGGQAEILIDDIIVDTIDLYSRYEDTASRYYRDLGPGAHSVTINVLGSGHPNSIGTRVHLDFFDVWDGQPLPDGTIEDDDDRLYYSDGWNRSLTPDASGGSFAVSGNANGTTAWFPFSGDSVTWQGWSRLTYQDVEVRINGVSQGLFDTYALDEGPRAFSFEDLGPGPHVLELRQYRDDAASVDAFITPAIGPRVQPPSPAIMRHEEDHPAMRYNGESYSRMPQSWSEQNNSLQVSRGYNLASSTADDVWSMSFEGEWLNIGFRSGVVSATAEIFIDGTSRGVFDTSGGVNNVKNFTFGNLAPGPHTVEVVVLSGTIQPDYMDVWGGQPIDGGWYDVQLENESSGLIHLSRKRWWRYFEDVYANDGDYLSPFASAQTNTWFNFTGTDLTVLAYEREATTLQVVINGVDQGVVDLSPTAPFRVQPRALHFPALGEGPHSVQVFTAANGLVTARIDAFEVNPADFFSYTPEVEWFDTTATETLPGRTGTGFLSTIAVGDINGDGVVELVAPGHNGRLYVYRGDGQDAGGGSPILWTSDLAGPAAEPALADLDGDGLAEIIVSGRDGTYAFRHDGQVLWSNPDVVSYFASQELAWSGPSVGNLDLDPEPEIVISSIDDALYVLDHEGNVVFSDPFGTDFPTVPVLADITGDGVLDIVVAEEWTLKVIDLFNGGVLAWSYDMPDPIPALGGSGSFGSPAVADLDADGRPEIIINWGHVIEALQDDGTLLWRYETNRTELYRPSPITVADVTGDGQPNLVTASAINQGFTVTNHLLMVLDAAGGLVWEQNVADNSASASGVAAQDLTGNGAWEIIWNGATDGFLIINGPDGRRLYNEPYTGSGTVLDYPTLADVDGDGEAEIITAGRNGLFVIGHPGRWVDSRPVWNQHTYHINNINNDWSIPFTEENSWEAHNTYRTQTPDRDPSCVLDLDGNPVPPTFIDLSPAGRALLPADRSLVISGRVLPVAANQPLLGVEIDGEAVDLLDASGSFFSAVELASGSNSFELHAMDRCAEAVATLVLEGGGDAADPWADLADASVLFEARFSSTTHDRGNERLLVDVQVDNAGPAVPGPILMTVGNDVDPAVGLLVADGFTPAGEPYVVIVPDGAVLAAGALSAVRPLAFSNPNRRSIDFTPRFLAPINQPPYFTSIPDGRATEGQPWAYDVGTADGNDDAVMLRLTSAPAGMMLNGTTIEWTPGATGRFDVVIEANDGRGATAQQGFVVKVEDASFNRPPVFITSPPTQRPTGATYSYTAAADDLDGDTLSFSLQAAPAGVTVDAATGLVEWAAAAPGQHSLVLVADDERGGQATQAWTLYVGEPATTVPGPAFSSVPQTFAAIGVQYRYAWRVTTFDGSTPTVSLLQAPPGMVLDPIGRTLTWVPSGADLGVQVIELQAVDAEGQVALQRFDLEVLTELPNQPPYMISTPTSAARIGSPYTYVAEAVDPEFEPLTWSLTTSPSGMTIDSATGQIEWTPGGSQSGDADVVVQAADPDGGIASQAFIVRVRAANSDPVINTVPPESVTFGAFYSVRMLAIDADGDSPTWRLLDGPAGMTLHASLGWLHWTTTNAVPGSYPVSLEVTDGWGGRDELNFTVELLADVQPPTVEIRMLREPACRGEPVTVCIDAADDVGLNSVTLTIDAQPRALDSSRCHLWTPAEAGQFAAAAMATDLSGQTTQANETLTVADCNDEQAPVVTLIAPLSGVAFDQPEPIVVTIEDNTPAVLTWDVTLRVPGSEQSRLLASGSGPVNAAEVAVFDPTTLQAGDYEIEVLASDGAQTGGIRFTMASGTGNKPGRVAFTSADLNWQLGALPLTIGRSYDSLDAGPLGRNTGDFSPGWRLALSASVEDTAPDLPPGSFILAGEPFTTQTRVTVVKPDGERVGFRFDPQLKSFPAVLQYEVNYEPDSGVTDTLRAVGWTDSVFSLGAGFADFLIPYNPTIYELETEEGVVYVISEIDGLLEVRDTQGGVLTSSEDGWQSSWGARVDYLRDTEQRITDIALIGDDGSSEIGRIVYGYDGAGNLISVTDLAGGVSTFEYDDPDLPHHITAMFDPVGRPIARIVFDEQGRQIAHCPGDADPVTLIGCSLFDFGADVSSQTVFDGRGFRSELFFDDRGLLVLQRDEIASDVWVEQSWDYNERGDEIEYIDGDGGVTLTDWDENRNRIGKTEPDGRRWTWTWGECQGEDEWLSRCDALGNCTAQELDESCSVIRSSDPLGGVTEFQFNEGQLTQRIDPVGEVVQTGFNDRGKLVSFTDALGAEVVSEYGEFGEQLAEIERDGTRRDFEYDNGIRIQSETWSGAGVGTSGIAWSHDAANLIDGLSWPGADVDLSYWPNGKIRRITHSSTSAPNWWIEYSYDANDNVTRLEDSFGGLTEYEYDGLNRMTEVRQSGPGVVPKRVVIDNSNTGQVVQMRRYASLDNSQPGPITDFEYGCLSCPTTLSRIVHRRPDGNPIHDLVYQRNDLHLITGLSDADGTHAFLHDGRGWLIQADHPPGFAAGDQSFVWDGAGNWLNRSGNFGGANVATLGYQAGQGGHRLLSDGVNSYQYDARGALVERSGPSGRIEIERDARGNAIVITEYDAADQVISEASYVYSSNQQRVRAERDGVVRHYIFDGPNPIIALNDAGQVVWRQLHLRDPDRPLAMEADGQLTWLLADHIGSVRNQADNAGQVLASFSYDAFGRQLSGAAPTLDDPVRYAGREFDLPGGMGYFRLRLYDPVIGRFLGTDILEPWHYRYADNNPLNFVDPSGALSAVEYGLLICGTAAAIGGGGGAAGSVKAAFAGNIEKFLEALANQLVGLIVPCGVPVAPFGD
jgi:RHS repeat-associated protein